MRLQKTGLPLEVPRSAGFGNFAVLLPLAMVLLVAGTWYGSRLFIGGDGGLSIALAPAEAATAKNDADEPVVVIDAKAQRASSIKVARHTKFRASVQQIAHATVFDPQTSQHAGIVLATLQASRMARSRPALGAVLNPAPLLRLSGKLATLEAQVAAAKAKVVLERQQMSQASSLFKHKTTSLANYQRAAEDLAANEALLKVAQAKRAAELAATQAVWGTVMAGILRHDSDPLPQLVAGKAMVVSLSLPPGTTLKSPPQHAEAEAAGTRFRLRLIGQAPGMLGRYPGQSFLYQATAQPGVPVGTTVSASLPAGPERTGVLVPGSAVVWQHGHALVFRAVKDNRYEPIQIATDTPSGNGYFVTAKLAPGDRVVVRGGDILLGLLEHAPAHPDDD